MSLEVSHQLEEQRQALVAHAPLGQGLAVLVVEDSPPLAAQLLDKNLGFVCLCVVQSLRSITRGGGFIVVLSCLLLVFVTIIFNSTS